MRRIFFALGLEAQSKDTKSPSKHVNREASLQNKHLAGGVVLTWERLSVPFCDISEGLAVHFTTDIIVCGAGNVDFTISIVVDQLPPSDLHTGTLKKKKKVQTRGQVGHLF